MDFVCLLIFKQVHIITLPRMLHFCKWTFTKFHLLGHVFYIYIVTSCFPGLPSSAKAYFLGEICSKGETNLHFVCHSWPFSKLSFAFSCRMLMIGFMSVTTFYEATCLNNEVTVFFIIVSAGPDNLVMFELWNYSQHSYLQVLHLWIKPTQNKNISKNHRMYADFSFLASFQNRWL